MIVSSVFPTCIVLGIAGWLDLEIYVGTILAPCVALGVTVDDVIHFMIWFRNGVRQGQSQYDALQLAWRACARPMYQSWFLLGVAMVTLLWCDLTSIRQFGATMAAMLTAGLVGNLVLVPAILAGRLGRLICPSVQTETKSLEAVPESA
jgi:predicted RND superfamily exporter protein